MKDNLCVIYARVSSGKQREKGLSLEVQENMLQTYADMQNFVIVKMWIATESAVKSGRKSFNEMVNYVKENNIKNILVQELDRISRNKGDSAIVDDLIEEGIVFHLVADKKIIDKNGENDVFMRDIEEAVARREILQMQKRTSRAKMKRLENGECVGQAPLGYINIPPSKNKKERFKKVEDTAAKVKKLLERYSSGLYTMGEMLDYAKKIELRSKQDKEIKVSAMRYILVNKFYCGQWKFTDKKAGKVFKGNSRGQWTPIVDKSIIEKNEKILESQTGPSKKRKGFDFRFRGLMTCGLCGRSILGGKCGYPPRTLKNGTIVSYDRNYYFCHSSPYLDKETGKKIKCHMPYFSEDLIESEIIRNLDLIYFDEEVWNKIKKQLFNFETKDLLKQEQKLLRTEQTKLEGRLDYLLDQKVKGKVKEDYFSEKKPEWEERIFDIRDELEILDIHIDGWNSDVGRMVELVDGLKNFQEKWISMTPKKGDSKKVQTEKKERQRNMLRLITRKISTYAYIGALTKQKFPGSKQPIVNKLHSRQLNFEFSPEFEILFELGAVKKFDNRVEKDKFQGIKSQKGDKIEGIYNKNYQLTNNSLTFYC